MNRSLIAIMLFTQTLLVSCGLLSNRNGNFKGDESKHLTCNVYLVKNEDNYQYFFIPENKPRKRIYISMNAQKGFWDSCIVALKENDSYMMIILKKKEFKIERYNNFKSLDSAYNFLTGGIKEIKLHNSSGIYDLLD
jgi:hypothetical protein